MRKRKADWNDCRTYPPDELLKGLACPSLPRNTLFGTGCMILMSYPHGTTRVSKFADCGAGGCRYEGILD